MTQKQRDAIAMAIGGFESAMLSDHLDYWLAGFYDCDIEQARQRAKDDIQLAKDGLYPALARAAKAAR